MTVFSLRTQSVPAMSGSSVPSTKMTLSSAWSMMYLSCSWREPDVKRVANSAGAGNAEIEFQVFEAVPGEGGDAVAGFHAERFQHIAQALDPPVEVGVAVFMPAAIGQFRFDRLLRCHALGMFDDRDSVNG